LSSLLEMREVTKSYGRRQVLRGVDMEVGPGSLVAVVGENGAGKSTLLKVAAGELPADGGEVRRSGRVGYCPQVPVLNDSLSIEQHFEYFAAAHGLVSLDRVERLLDLLSFRRFRHDVVGQLSGGTRQKLNLALAVMHDPDLLLLDEPYQGFDWETYLRFWDLVDETRSRGRAVLVITHLVFDEERFDAIYRLEDGRTRMSETRPGDRHALA
jgi:ABC-2 type transport system ATP-binding protein